MHQNICCWRISKCPHANTLLDLRLAVSTSSSSPRSKATHIPLNPDHIIFVLVHACLISVSVFISLFLSHYLSLSLSRFVFLSFFLIYLPTIVSIFNYLSIYICPPIYRSTSSLPIYRMNCFAAYLSEVVVQSHYNISVK